MRNPDRKFYRFPFEAGMSGLFLGVCLSALIMFISNDTISQKGLFHLLVTLGGFFSIGFAFVALLAGFLWRLLWEWPHGKWFLPFVVLAVMFVYGWNLFLFRLFMRPQQKMVLFFELALFLVLFVVSLLREGSDERGLRIRLRPVIFISVCVLILAVNSFIHPLRVPEVQPSRSYEGNLPAQPIYLLGIDGADWKVMLPLVKMGKIPCFSYFVHNGSYDYLKTFDPTSSPLIWTTIATGKDPFEHGIRDFGIYVLKPLDCWISVLPKGAGFRKIAAIFQKMKLWEFHPASSMQIQSKTVWKIANESGIPVAVSNWPVSIPVRPVYGLMSGETDYFLYHGIQPDNAVFPRYFGEDVMSDRHTTDSMQTEKLDPDALLSSLQLVSSTSKQMARAWSTFLYGASKWPVPLRFFYTHSLDLTQHLFWRFGFREEGNTKGEGEQYEHAFHIIEEHLVEIDLYMAQLFESLVFLPYTFIVSDHGFRTIYFYERFLNSQSNRRVQGVHDYSPPGILLAHGPSVIHHYLGNKCSVFDVTPTLLDVLGLPRAADMSGASFLPRILGHADAAKEDRDRPVIKTYETAKSAPQRSAHVASDDAIEARLKAIGYIE